MLSGSNSAIKPVILDVDTGIDDAMAIAYAAHSPELKLLGLTTLYGNVSVEEATRNTLYVLELLGREDIPVYAGANKPLVRSKDKFAKFVHGDDGIGGMLGEAVPKTKAGSLTAAQFMVRQARNRPGQIAFICVGPLTNLAQAVRLDPDFPRLAGQVVIMGGAVNVTGNVTKYAEANIHSDPEAADIVFRSGLPVTLVGLDVTMKTLLPRCKLQEWHEKGTPISRFLAGAASFYINFYENKYPGIGGCALHDPLAVGVAIDPTLCRTETMPVEVELQDEFVGRTCAGRNGASAGGPAINVCLEVDAERFLEHFLSRVV